MAWRRGQSYSEDLRARVLAAVDGGMAARAAARLFRVSVSYIYKALIRRRRTGEVSASSRRGHRPRKLTVAQEAALASHIAAHPDLTADTVLACEASLAELNTAVAAILTMAGLHPAGEAGPVANPNAIPGAIPGTASAPSMAPSPPAAPIPTVSSTT